MSVSEEGVLHIWVMLYRDVNNNKVFVYSLQHPSNSLLPGVLGIVFLQILSNCSNDYRGILLVHNLLAESL